MKLTAVEHEPAAPPTEGRTRYRACHEPPETKLAGTRKMNAQAMSRPGGNRNNFFKSMAARIKADRDAINQRCAVVHHLRSVDTARYHSLGPNIGCPSDDPADNVSFLSAISTMEAIEESEDKADTFECAADTESHPEDPDTYYLRGLVGMALRRRIKHKLRNLAEALDDNMDKSCEARDDSREPEPSHLAHDAFITSPTFCHPLIEGAASRVIR